ncbi:iron chelate uptake ABC transporter family permease subunit [Microvirga mediterraneensis]|uniref:Iron chelate uptake ABC transporter family permease subunit n=1 Tax=Microvirga mediterraneensis TaxID=2754695 RepID=A0A838BMB9_9HYPH|nr:iron chelate uptake ABC transporter family permease subunit [Microvirga mediterraneensis]
MKSLSLALAAVTALALISLLIGASDLSLAGLLSPQDGSQATRILVVSRIPRTVALILAGMAMAVAGLIMQMLTQNRFVEPSTAGTVESAGLGLLTVTLFTPDLPVIGKMLAAAGFALAGTALFLRILRLVPLRSALTVPLVGIMLGGIISAITTFFAYRFDLMQSLNAWTTGDFSGVLRGRYELLWMTFGLALLAYLAADRLTLAGMGRDFATNLGLRYRSIVSFGLVIVSMVTATVVVTVGMMPFLGLIVPNVVGMMIGDNMRRALPWVAAMGAGLVLVCDVVGRVVYYPYEIPIGTIMGIIGGALFLVLLLKGRGRLA